VSDLHETGWQDVLKEAPDELDGIEGHGAPPAGIGVLVGESDGMVIVAEDAIVGDGNTKEITS